MDKGKEKNGQFPEKEGDQEILDSSEERKIDEIDNENDVVSKLENERIFLIAEIENMKKRHLREKSDVIRYSNQKLISKMVSLLDNYETALKTSEMVNDDNVKKFLSGILMAVEDFKGCLKNEGVEEYHIKLGEDIWDSRFCEVVDEVESNDYEEGTILDIVKKGYFLNGRMIRPASVVISKKNSN